jgi:hypothetical protein
LVCWFVACRGPLKDGIKRKRGGGQREPEEEGTHTKGGGGARGSGGVVCVCVCVCETAPFQIKQKGCGNQHGGYIHTCTA